MVDLSIVVWLRLPGRVFHIVKWGWVEIQARPRGPGFESPSLGKYFLFGPSYPTNLQHKQTIQLPSGNLTVCY